ncbi:zinc finger MYM-type protein 5-like [Stegodyphus dumicola]|uniref:zinc finger MYM-type protein 5-like n=1 Tax=Stegodyphus dumicola TaxID=202533 RepID=UPI0015AD38D3|nr:zinc finger MYM-type protein 5-like [Stegodyphus dumicola]
MSHFIKKTKISSGVNDAHTESASESITKEQTSSSQRTSAALDEVIERTDETPKEGKDDPSLELNKSEVRDYPGNSMEETGINENSFLYINFDDSAKWPTLSDKVRMTLSGMGPIQRKGLMYPKSNNGRKFSDTYYNRKMENRELVPRTWLLYFISTNSVFCFCCKIFASVDSSSSLVKGYNDWLNVSKVCIGMRLVEHI